MKLKLKKETRNEFFEIFTNFPYKRMKDKIMKLNIVSILSQSLTNHKNVLTLHFIL
jgi:hypothetical protein